MAQYQMSYGFDNEGQSKPTMPDPEPDPAAQEEAAKKAKLVTIKYICTRELPGVALVNCAISHIFTII